MTMKDRLHDEAMAELFKEDPKFAAATLDAILADEDQGELLVTLRQMALAFGGIAKIAEAAQLNKNQLYRTLSKEGNPAVSSLNAILHAMGLRLSITPLKTTLRKGRTNSRARPRAA
jgi:probable addiction module antidote protein